MYILNRRKLSLQTAQERRFFECENKEGYSHSFKATPHSVPGRNWGTVVALRWARDAGKNPWTVVSQHAREAGVGSPSPAWGHGRFLTPSVGDTKWFTEKYMTFLIKLVMEQRLGGCVNDYKRITEVFWGYEIALYPDCHNGYSDLCMCSN